LKIIAHRGASAHFPEQSGAAIAAAWAQGADGVEVDLRLTADRRLLLQHDASLLRCCGDARRVAQLDSRQRHGLNACHGRPDLPAEAPLMVEEFLERVPPGRLAVLELKEGPAQAEALARALGRRHRDIWLISFHRDTLRHCQRLLPDLPILWLRKGRQPPLPRTRRAWMRTVAAAGWAGLDLADSLVDRVMAAELAAAGLTLGVWTVDDPRRARELEDLGVAWLTSNRPGEINRKWP
jgi:glycerophosphoryl diester phosphodiesterase